MATPVLYYLRISSPCRSVQLTADVLNLELKLENVDLFKGKKFEIQKPSDRRTPF